MSLVFKDLSHDRAYSAWKTLFTDAVKVCKFVRGHQTPAALLRKLSSKTCIMPADTRFAKYFLVVVRLLSLKNDLRKMLLDDKFDAYEKRNTKEKRRSVIKPVKKLINKNSMWKMAEFFVQLLGPTYKLLRALDGDSPMIADLIPEYQELIVKAELMLHDEQWEWAKHLVRDFLRILRERWTYMYHPVMGAAYALNPKYIGTALKPMPGVNYVQALQVRVHTWYALHLHDSMPAPQHQLLTRGSLASNVG